MRAALPLLEQEQLSILAGMAAIPVEAAAVVLLDQRRRALTAEMEGLLEMSAARVAAEPMAAQLAATLLADREPQEAVVLAQIVVVAAEMAALVIQM